MPVIARAIAIQIVPVIRHATLKQYVRAKPVITLVYALAMERTMGGRVVVMRHTLNGLAYVITCVIQKMVDAIATLQTIRKFVRAIICVTNMWTALLAT